MNRAIENIDYKEVLKYLGYNNFQGHFEMEREIDGCIKELKALVKPRIIAREYELNGLQLVGSTLEFSGSSVKQLLETSHSVVIFAATLGSQADYIISKYSKSDLHRALVMDSVASVAIESICESFEYEVKVEKSKEGFFITDRYSPGYGDMDIKENISICKVLDTSRKIGMSTSQSGIMIPRKSVTAFMGVSKVKQKYRERGCGNCAMAKDCRFRKKGLVCHA